MVLSLGHRVVCCTFWDQEGAAYANLSDLTEGSALVMATYESVTNQVEGSWPETTYLVPAAGTCASGYLTSQAGTAGVPPTSTTMTYTPNRETITKWDPTKGSNRKWSAIKKSGQISFTPYSKRSVKDEWFVVPREMASFNWRRRTGGCYASVPYICSYDDGPERFESSWTENVHIDTLPAGFSYDQPTVGKDEYEEEISSAISSTQQSAFAKAMSTYDILTELGEAKETFGFLHGKLREAAKSLSDFANTTGHDHRRTRKLSPKLLLRAADKKLRRIGSRWMEYRYAIMPIIYTIDDIKKLLAQRSFVYKTGRDFAVIELNRTDAPSGDTHIRREISCQAVVRSAMKLGYNEGALQRLLGQTSFNVFQTAWELIPYSFVADWFVNFGDAISVATSIDLSSQRLGYTSVRRVEKDEYFLVDRRSEVFSKTFTHSACGDKTATYVFNHNTDGLLYRRSVDSYERSVFHRPAPKLHFDPFLNWQRFVDATVLSSNQSRKLLRSL